MNTTALIAPQNNESTTITNLETNFTRATKNKSANNNAEDERIIRNKQQLNNNTTNNLFPNLFIEPNENLRPLQNYMINYKTHEGWFKLFCGL